MTKYFEEIEDRRQQGKIKYLLVEVIVMTIIAVTAGADNWGEIAMYCKGKITMFQEKFGLKLGQYRIIIVVQMRSQIFCQIA